MALVRMMRVACVSIALAGVARAQAVLYELTGSSAFDAFGSTLAAVGDVDDDGRMDFAVGAAYDDLYGSNAGRVLICSGATGAVLLELHGSVGDHFGQSVAQVFDFDGDGIGDVLVGASGAGSGGRAYIFRLPDGALIQTKSWFDPEGFGFQVAGLGDITGDGHPDFGVRTAVTDIFGPFYPGCFYFYSGAGGGLDPADSCGASVYDAAGDVNGDGVDDFLTSNSGLLVSGPLHVELRSGVSFDLLDLIIDDDIIDFVSGFRGRDFDGDGQPEYLFTYRGPITKRVVQVRRLPSGGGPPEILFSITIGSAQYPWVGTIESACCADVTGDGTPDILLGCPSSTTSAGSQAGSILAFDGLDPHDLLFHIDGEVAAGHFPTTLVGLGDLDGDGGEEFAAGVSETTTTPGAVRVYSWVRWLAAWSEYGLSGPTHPHLSGEGLPAPLSTITLLADAATPAAPSFLVIGLASQELPFKGGLLEVAPDVVVGPIWTSPTGNLTLSGQVPASVPPGLNLYFQLWVQPLQFGYDWQYSNGLQATIHSG